MQSTVSLVFLYNNLIIEDILQTSITERDGYASTFAASRLLLTMFPNLDIRNTSLNEKKFDKLINWDSFRNQEQGPYFKQLKYLRNPNFYVWNHFFCQAPLWEIGSDSYYIITLQTSDLELLSLRNKFMPLNEKNTLHRVILNEEYKKIEKTFIFLNVKDSEFCQVTSSKLYIDTIGLFNGLYRRKQEEWFVYTISKGEYPPTEILKRASAFIIPGSTSSAYDNKQWIKNLSKFLLDSYEQYPQLKMIGICFGFQLLCSIFGGHVEPTRLRKKNKFYNYLGNSYKVHLNSQVREIKCFQQMNLPESLSINRVHGDIVQQIPSNFINCGSSNIVRNEIVISQDERIFGMQCHPEYSSQLLSVYASYIKSQQEKTSFNRVLSDKDFQTFFKNQTDQQSLLMCLYFLKY